MPRERIHHGKTYVTVQEQSTAFDLNGEPIASAILTYMDDGTTPVPAYATVTREPSLDIEWQRDAETVQISIEMDRPGWRAFIHDMPNEAVAHAIHTPSLSRTEINSLIRHLRRARDAAFGSDE